MRGRMISLKKGWPWSPADLYIRPLTDLVGTYLVWPASMEHSAEPLTVSNGAVMFPNTFMMQELIRMYFDSMLDQEDEGHEVETPFIYTFAQGKSGFR